MMKQRTATTTLVGEELSPPPVLSVVAGGDTKKKRYFVVTVAALSITFWLSTTLQSSTAFHVNVKSETSKRKVAYKYKARRSYPRTWQAADDDDDDADLTAWPHSSGRYEYELPTKITYKNEPSTREKDRQCSPYATWYDKSYPTCNTMHEIDFPAGVVADDDGGGDGYDGDGNRGVMYIRHLSDGASRQGWALRNSIVLNDKSLLDPPLVFKNLRYVKEYTEKMFEHQRLDALATEHLTSSPHVVNIYGYCGESAINTYADNGDLLHYVTDSSAKNTTISPTQRLMFARNVTLGLAAIHGSGEERNMVHHDIKPLNLLVVSGTVKFHDFNNARLVSRNCPIQFKGSCNTRIPKEIEPPEECVKETKYSEKYEVFRLGLIFYFLLTNQNPGKIYDGEKHVILNNPPSLPREVEKSKDPALRALIDAMNLALTRDPKRRPSARSLADTLIKAVSELQ